MAEQKESEEKEELLSSNEHEFDSNELIEIYHPIPGEPAQRHFKTKTHPNVKRTFLRLDHLPNSFIEKILNGSHDQKQNSLNHQRKAISKCGKWSLLFVIAIDISLLVLIIFSSTHKNGDNEGWKLFSIPFVIALCLYSIEWFFFCSITESLKNIKSKDEIDRYLDKMHNDIRPVIKWNLQSYHFEIGPNEESIKQITHQTCMEYHFNLHKDESTDFTLNPFELTKLSLFKTWRFADNETKKDYDEKFKEFVDSHRDKDEYQHVNVELELDGFKNKILINETANEHESRLWTDGWFIIFSCLLCSPCFRYFFHSRTGIKTHIIQKKVSILPIFQEQIVDI